MGKRVPGAIRQDSLPPFTMSCSACGVVWTPKPAAGQRKVTAARLDAEAHEHWRACPGETP